MGLVWLADEADALVNAVDSALTARDKALKALKETSEARLRAQVEKSVHAARKVQMLASEKEALVAKVSSLERQETDVEARIMRMFERERAAMSEEIRSLRKELAEERTLRAAETRSLR